MVGGQRPPRKPLAGRRSAGGRSPAGDERPDLCRRPTVQLQSTGTAAFSKHTRLHPYVLLDTAYLSLTLSMSYCVCLCLSLTQTLTQKGEETETAKTEQ